MNMKLLVISDLHVGATARAKDFSTNTESITCRNTPDYMGDLKTLAEDKSIQVTHILIAGDITDRAEHEEFELAAIRIKEIAQLFRVDDKNTFFIPGNHDANWGDEKSSSSKSEPLALQIKKKYTNISYNSYFEGLLKNSKMGAFYEEPYASIWINDDIVVVGINSSAYDAAEGSIHHGSVETKHLEEIKKKLEEQDLTDKVKVLLTHHHPKNYTDLTFQDNDFSIMKNAESFLQFSTELEFDFIVHGHKHIPRFGIHWDAMNSPVVSLCAGSFSSSLKDYHNGVANFFHIIEVEGKCPSNHNVLGKVISWAYFDNHKWKEASINRDNICFEEYFGNIKNKRVLKANLISEIESSISKINRFRWTSLLSKQPDLKYCNRNLLQTVIKDICSELNLEYCPMESGDFLILAEDTK